MLTCGNIVTERNHLVVGFTPESSTRMLVEGLRVMFTFFQFQVARSNECLGVLQFRVVEPLWGDWMDECTTILLRNFICWWETVWRPPICKKGRQTTPKKRETFDSTKGYPGEDVTAAFVSLDYPFYA